MDKDKDILEFGIKRENEERRDGGCGVIFDPKTKKFAVGREENGRLRLFAGGTDPGETKEEGAIREVKEESGLYDFLYVEKLAEVYCHFYNPTKKINRMALSTCVLIILKSTDTIPTKHEEHENFVLEWAIDSELINYWQSRNEDKSYDHWIYFLEKAQKRIKELGYNI